MRACVRFVVIDRHVLRRTVLSDMRSWTGSDGSYRGLRGYGCVVLELASRRASSDLSLYLSAASNLRCIRAITVVCTRLSGRCMRREWDWEVLVELEVSPLFMFLKKRLETAKNSAARSPVARVAGAEPPAD